MLLPNGIPNAYIYIPKGIKSVDNMIIYMLVAIVLLSLAADGYIWVCCFREERRRIWSVSYRMQAVLLDVVLPAAFYVVTIRYGREGVGAQAMLWLMWGLLLSFFRKRLLLCSLCWGDCFRDGSVFSGLSGEFWREGLLL